MSNFQSSTRDQHAVGCCAKSIKSRKSQHRIAPDDCMHVRDGEPYSYHVVYHATTGFSFAPPQPSKSASKKFVSKGSYSAMKVDKEHAVRHNRKNLNKRRPKVERYMQNDTVHCVDTVVSLSQSALPNSDAAIIPTENTGTFSGDLQHSPPQLDAFVVTEENQPLQASQTARKRVRFAETDDEEDRPNKKPRVVVSENTEPVKALQPILKCAKLPEKNGEIRPNEKPCDDVAKMTQPVKSVQVNRKRARLVEDEETAPNKRSRRCEIEQNLLPITNKIQPSSLRGVAAKQVIVEPPQKWEKVTIPQSTARMATNIRVTEEKAKDAAKAQKKAQEQQVLLQKQAREEEERLLEEAKLRERVAKDQQLARLCVEQGRQYQDGGKYNWSRCEHNISPHHQSSIITRVDEVSEMTPSPNYPRMTVAEEEQTRLNRIVLDLDERQNLVKPTSPPTPTTPSFVVPVILNSTQSPSSAKSPDESMTEMGTDPLPAKVVEPGHSEGNNEVTDEDVTLVSDACDMDYCKQENYNADKKESSMSSECFGQGSATQAPMLMEVSTAIAGSTDQKEQKIFEMLECDAKNALLEEGWKTGDEGLEAALHSSIDTRIDEDDEISEFQKGGVRLLLNVKYPQPLKFDEDSEDELTNEIDRMLLAEKVPKVGSDHVEFLQYVMNSKKHLIPRPHRPFVRELLAQCCSMNTEAAWYEDDAEYFPNLLDAAFDSKNPLWKWTARPEGQMESPFILRQLRPDYQIGLTNKIVEMVNSGKPFVLFLQHLFALGLHPEDVFPEERRNLMRRVIPDEPVMDNLRLDDVFAYKVLGCNMKIDRTLEAITDLDAETQDVALELMNNGSLDVLQTCIEEYFDNCESINKFDKAVAIFHRALSKAGLSAELTDEQRKLTRLMAWQCELDEDEENEDEIQEVRDNLTELLSFRYPRSMRWTCREEMPWPSRYFEDKDDLEA